MVGRQDSALEPYKLFCPIENKAPVVPYGTDTEYIANRSHSGYGDRETSCL